MRLLPWLPTILGVAALLAFTVVTIVRLTPEQSRTLPPPVPAFTLPGTTSGPQAPISLVPTTAPTTTAPTTAQTTDPSSPDPRPTSRAIPAVITPPRTTTRPVLVSGHFHVLNSYADNFIGEVLLTNHTGEGQNWVVTLSYPGKLRTSWLESLPQPTLVQRGDTYTWTSSVPLAPGSNAQMRFQFDKVSGSEAVTGCAVNGNPCR